MNKAVFCSAISGKVAAAIDVELMGNVYGFSIDQLMELAGLAVAKACFLQHPPYQFKNVLFFIGPGSKAIILFIIVPSLTEFRQWRRWIGCSEASKALWLQSFYCLPKTATESIISSELSLRRIIHCAKWE